MPFQPGQSGNPGGRPRDNQRVKLLAQAHTEAAVATLAMVMNSEEAKYGERVAAASAILDRGYGKPAQTIGGDAELDPIQVTQIQRVIVDPRDKDPKGI